MGDYLANLVTRTLRPADTVRPRPRALFEPVAREGLAAPVEMTDTTAASPGVSSPSPPEPTQVPNPVEPRPSTITTAAGPHPLGPPFPPSGEGVGPHPLGPPLPMSGEGEETAGRKGFVARGFRGEGSKPPTPPTELTATGPDSPARETPFPPSGEEKATAERGGTVEQKRPLSQFWERGSRGEGPRGKEPTETEAAPSPPAPAIRPREVTPALPREPDVASKTSTAEPPVVRVTIGRVEIRAASPKPTPPIQRAKLRRPAVSLADYLERRNRGRA